MWLMALTTESPIPLFLFSILLVLVLVLNMEPNIFLGTGLPFYQYQNYALLTMYA